MEVCCSYLLSFICASTDSCYCKLDSLQGEIVFLKIKVIVRHITNVREDTLPPYHPQFMRSVDFQKMFVVSVTGTEILNQNDSILLREIVLSIITVYFIAGTNVHTVTKIRLAKQLNLG